MADQAMFTIERINELVAIRLVPIPDSLEDEDGSAGAGIAFSRRDALHFAWKIINAVLRPLKSNTLTV